MPSPSERSSILLPPASDGFPDELNISDVGTFAFYWPDQELPIWRSCAVDATTGARIETMSVASSQEGVEAMLVMEAAGRDWPGLLMVVSVNRSEGVESILPDLMSRRARQRA